MAGKKGQTIIQALILVAIIFLWVNFAPTQIGGQSSYVMLSGTSMLPDFHKWDLVIVRSATEYQIGDVVGYRHPQIGVVFHRIVDQQNGRFILQGDNNDWLDSYDPTAEEIIGKAWIQIPGAGYVLNYLRQPMVFATLIFLIGIYTYFSVLKEEEDLGRRNIPMRSIVKNFKGLTLTRNAQDIIFFILALLALFIFLMVVSFTKPVKVQTQEDFFFQHQGTYSYSAETSPALYDNNTFESGDPVFRLIADWMDISFTYQPDQNLENPLGSYRMYALVEAEIGWQRSLELIPQTSFSETPIVAEARLNFSQIATLITLFESQTGFNYSNYDVTIITEVEIHGTYQNTMIDSYFMPEMSFVFSPLAVNIREMDPELNLSAATNHQIMVETDNYTKLLFWEFPIQGLRTFSFVGFILTILSLGGYIAVLYRNSQKPDDLQFQFFFGNRMVIAHDQPESDRIVKIQSKEDFINVVDNSESPLLSYTKGKTTTYYIKLDESWYSHAIKSTDEKGDG